MKDQIPLSEEAIADLPHLDDKTHQIASDLAYLRLALNLLARDFERIAVPEDGKYVHRPATAEDGSAYQKTS